MTILEQIRQPVQADFEQFENLLHKQVAADNQLLSVVLQHTFKNPGKQLRPTLLLLSARVFGMPDRKTWFSAVAYEMLHCASLLHDDVVDVSARRHGHDTVNQHWGNKVAVLTGDYLLANAIRTGIESGVEYTVRSMAEVGCNLADGELFQMRQADAHRFNQDAYYKIIAQKTACMFRACAASGAASVGASSADVALMAAFGELLGMCFQIKDDILDYVGTALLGKPTMTDIREGKVTLPLIKAFASAPEGKQSQMRSLLSQTTYSDADLHAIRAFIDEQDGFSKAGDIMLQYKGKAAATPRVGSKTIAAAAA